MLVSWVATTDRFHWNFCEMLLKLHIHTLKMRHNRYNMSLLPIDLPTIPRLVYCYVVLSMDQKCLIHTPLIATAKNPILGSQP